ncbi:hypothetical protein [Lapidilactobacillus wuchangensis]|uniref:hypothetical protein n=1 Tax=Lapidilactobacillus wuchangensis TaxID=2486001 RepID=UPI000F7899FC|nr:hypothetical protein [Lapidilactobacillus wuchangensis]
MINWKQLKQQAAPFSALLLSITSFTVNILPYLLLPQLILRQHVVILNALPFVLFYTFRRTVLFLFRGYQPRAERLLTIGVVAGILGSFLGLFGSWLPIFWDLAGVGIGIASALLPPAIRVFGHRQKQQHLPKIKHSALYQYGALLLLILLIQLAGGDHIVWSFAGMLLYLLLGGVGFWASPLRQPWTPFRLHNAKRITINLILTAAIFIGLINLRMTRNEGTLTTLLHGLIFLAIILPIGLLLFSWHLSRGNDRITWTIRARGILRGMCIDFVAVYGTIYCFVILGSAFYVWVILMYVVAMAIGAPLLSFLAKKIPAISRPTMTLLLMALGLVLTFWQPVYLVGILCLRIVVGELNREVIGELDTQTPLTPDEEYLVAPRLLSLGGLTLQMILWLIMIGIANQRGIKLAGLLASYAHKTVAGNFTNLISTTHLWLVIVMFVAGVIVYLIDQHHQVATD